MAQQKKKAPWDKPNPKGTGGNTRHLSSAQKSTARRGAKKAGRPYPNLVDNMRAAAQSKSKSKKKRKS